MKYKWYFTPWGWLRALVFIGLMVGAAFVEGILSITMIVVGLILLVYSYATTYRNVRRRSSEEEPKQESDKEWAERELKPLLKEKSERDS